MCLMMRYDCVWLCNSHIMVKSARMYRPMYLLCSQHFPTWWMDVNGEPVMPDTAIEWVTGGLNTSDAENSFGKLMTRSWTGGTWSKAGRNKKMLNVASHITIMSGKSHLDMLCSISVWTDQNDFSRKKSIPSSIAGLSPNMSPTHGLSLASCLQTAIKIYHQRLICPSSENVAFFFGRTDFRPSANKQWINFWPTFLPVIGCTTVPRSGALGVGGGDMDWASKLVAVFLVKCWPFLEL